MKPDEIRAIWIMQLSMKNFHDFLKGFQPKISYIPWSRIRTQKFAPFFTSSAEGEAILYDTNFRRVQQIGKPLAILTSNIVHPWPSWHAIPTLKETAKHPREVIPAVYQVLMDLILDICWYNVSIAKAGIIITTLKVRNFRSRSYQSRRTKIHVAIPISWFWPSTHPWLNTGTLGTWKRIACFMREAIRTGASRFWQDWYRRMLERKAKLSESQRVKVLIQWRLSRN